LSDESAACRARGQKVQFFAPYWNGRSVLDVGCAGQGYDISHPAWLHGIVCRSARYCVGLDHDKGAVDAANRAGYQLVHADAQRFSFQERFEVVNALDVIEHLEDPKGFFGSVSECLLPGGVLLLSTPNPWFFMRTLRCFLKNTGGANPDHVTWFCTETISELLRRNGFAVERIAYGSGERRLYWYRFLPASIRHTSIFIVARLESSNTPIGSLT